MKRVLFICLGNICRSPAAEAVLTHKTKKQLNLEVQSCGLGDWHVGQLPDERMRVAAKKRGISLLTRAQQFHPSFFDTFDYLMAADQEIKDSLRQLAKTEEHKGKVQLFTIHSTLYPNEDIPDPFYLEENSFEQVLDMIEDACTGLISHLRDETDV